MKVTQSCLILCDPMDLVHAVLYVKYINKTKCKNNEFFGELFVNIVKVKSILRLTRCKLLFLQKFRWFKILFLINIIEDHCNCINGYLICTHYGNLFLEQSALLFLFHKYCCKTHLKKKIWQTSLWLNKLSFQLLTVLRDSGMMKAPTIYKLVIISKL